MSSAIESKICFFTAFLLSLFILFFPPPTQAEEISNIVNPIAKNGTWVADSANILSDRVEKNLNQTIDKLERTNGTEIVVLTINKTPSNLSAKEFATQVFDTWKIGKPERANGILFLVSLGDGRVEIETGITIKTIISDREISNIVRSEVIPPLQQQDFELGISQGTNKLVDILETIEYVLPKDNVPQIEPLSFAADIIPMILLGFFGALYYYGIARWLAINILEEIYLANNYSKNLLVCFSIYALLYISCVFISNLIVLPILASISPFLFVMALIILHFYWIILMQQKEPRAMSYIILVMIISPIIFAFFSINTLCSAIALPLIFTIFKIQTNNTQISLQDKNKNYLSIALIIIFSWLLLITAVNFIGSYGFRQGTMFVFWGFESSIPIIYLVWKYFKKKFQLPKASSFLTIDNR